MSNNKKMRGIFFSPQRHQAEPGRMFAFRAQFFILPFHSRFLWVSILSMLSTRLSLDVCSHSGSVFYFTFSLAFSVGIYFVNASHRLSLDARSRSHSVFILLTAHKSPISPDYCHQTES